MPAPEPIPTPLPRLLAELAQRGLPIVVFAGVLVLVLWLWNLRMGPDTVPGEVDAVRIVITAPQAGMILEMRARDFQDVAQGEILGKLLATDQKATVEFKAPMNGRVGFVNCHAGESVQGGEALLTLTAAKADRIVCFLRQPFSVDVQPQQPALIRSRGLGQHTAPAVVVKVGSELAPVRKTLLPPAHDRGELGLPVLLTVPTGLKLRPGELVDVTFLPGSSPVGTHSDNTAAGTASGQK